MPTSEPMIALLRGALENWRNRETSRMASQFREDAVLSSAFIPEGAATVWVQGREDILAHLADVRSRFSRFEIFDVASNTTLYVVLIMADAQLLTVVVEPDRGTTLIRRIILCRSIRHLLWPETG